MKYLKLNLIIVFLSVTLYSCTKDNIFLPDLNGNLVGYVYTLNEFRQPYSDHSGVTITALGKDKVYTVSSDKMGRFEFVNLPTGTYELHFEKSGFGTLKQFGVKHLGGQPTVIGLPFEQNSYGSAFLLIEKPTTGIMNLNISNDSLNCTFSITKPEPAQIILKIYFSRAGNFSSESASWSQVVYVQNKGILYSGKISIDEYGFDPGEKIYFMARLYPYSPSAVVLDNSIKLTGVDNYYDYDTNKTVYPSLGEESSIYYFIYAK